MNKNGWNGMEDLNGMEWNGRMEGMEGTME